jgi:N-acetyl-gamma-glutamyl-phosphate reductase
MHFVEVDENFRAYGLFTHRHTPEVIEHLGLGADDVMFSTHLLPVARGILSTMYVWLDAPREAGEIEALYRKFYAGKPMVRLWAAGQLPELQHVAHTNFCDIGFALDAGGQRLVLVSCLDGFRGNGGPAMRYRKAGAGCTWSQRNKWSAERGAQDTMWRREFVFNKFSMRVCQ